MANKTILLSFDEDLLLDTRKALFRKNVSVQQFVTYAFHKLVLADPGAVELLDKAAKFNEEILAEADAEKIVNIDAAALYAMFEDKERG